MEKVLKRHHISFQTAWAGVRWALRTQPNFRVHLVAATVAVVAGIYLKITRLEMLIIIFTVILGLSAEMINTSLEAMTDLITSEWRQEAQIAKDVAAGMMLVVAAGAVVVAAIIFWPYVVPRFF